MRIATVLGMLMIPVTSHAGAYDDFFRAAKVDNASEIKALLARGLDPNIIEPQRGETGMILAIRENSMKVFDVLLNARDIDLEIKARNGDNALMIASFTGNKPVVEALLAKGAQVNRPGWTPLHYASLIGNNDIVRLLIENHAYIDAASPNKTTPIMMAALGGHILTVKLLLDEGADATLRNELGLSAIDIAAMHNHTDIAEGLTYRLKKAGKL
ncbi:ankyrin repeat domain-containing protein [Noviherbaspirillum cavernae]|nr:ankyrin repeat domain-containing protein [Noviherbaspirillum cavernae]